MIFLLFLYITKSYFLCYFCSLSCDSFPSHHSVLISFLVLYILFQFFPFYFLLFLLVTDRFIFFVLFVLYPVTVSLPFIPYSFPFSVLCNPLHFLSPLRHKSHVLRHPNPQFPQIRAIVQELLKVIKETENDDLTNVMCKIVTTYTDQLTPIAVEMCTQLAATFQQVSCASPLPLRCLITKH